MSDNTFTLHLDLDKHGVCTVYIGMQYLIIKAVEGAQRQILEDRFPPEFILQAHANMIDEVKSIIEQMENQFPWIKSEIDQIEMTVRDLRRGILPSQRTREAGI